MPKFQVTGSVYFADGLDTEVECSDEEAAREIAEQVARMEATEAWPELTLTEVCIEDVRKMDFDPPRPMSSLRRDLTVALGSLGAIRAMEIFSRHAKDRE